MIDDIVDAVVTFELRRRVRLDLPLHLFLCVRLLKVLDGVLAPGCGAVLLVLVVLTECVDILLELVVLFFGPIELIVVSHF